MKRTKILISAFACHPAMGSEEGVGWGWANALARHHQVHVIAREARKYDIEDALLKKPSENLSFHYVDPPKWMIFWKRGPKNFMAYAALWQLFAFAKALSMARREKFDIIQHLTYGNLWLPSYLFLLPGNYIWGPVGGGLVPKAFAESYRFRERLIESLRCFTLRYLSRINIPVLLGMVRAGLILVRTDETLKLLPDWARRKAAVIPETALDLKLFPCDTEQRRELCFADTLVIVYAGRILSLKNLHLAVAAFRAVLKRYPNLSGRIRFDIYGEGPYLTVCREMAGDETGSSIFFHGFIDRKVLMEKLKSAHLFIHLSVKDTAATAPMEAMALGLPVICVNCGGMGNMVDSGCGILLDPSSPGHIIEGSIIAISELFGDRDRLLNLSLNARQKIERTFTWESRAEQYNQILQKNWKDV